MPWKIPSIQKEIGSFWRISRLCNFWNKEFALLTGHLSHWSSQTWMYFSTSIWVTAQMNIAASQERPVSPNPEAGRGNIAGFWRCHSPTLEVGNKDFEREYEYHEFAMGGGYLFHQIMLLSLELEEQFHQLFILLGIKFYTKLHMMLFLKKEILKANFYMMHCRFFLKKK